MRRMVVVLAAGVLALTACGGDDDDDAGGDVSAEAQPYVDAMVASSQQQEEGELSLSPEQAECVAPKWIDTIGVERLEEAGMTPEDLSEDGMDDLDTLELSEDDGAELYDAFGTCDVDVKDLFLESLASDSDLTDEDRACLDENFGDDLLKRIMITSLTQGDDALDEDQELTGELFAVFAECPGAAG